MSNKQVVDFLPEIMELVKAQLESDQLRWGDTWKHRSIDGQEERIFYRYFDYLDQFTFGGVRVPWEKVIGEAIIAMIRELHPEELEVEDE